LILVNRHHIIRLRAMAPYAKSMAEFMNSGGLLSLRLSTLETPSHPREVRVATSPDAEPLRPEDDSGHCWLAIESQCAGAEGVAGRFEYGLGPETSPE
jgi:hypothetical protein